ncbi:hypothetical protein DIPPA_01996 [Diplonema papillatum]|nr:hypothetical protein DIPPA_01996 [Diplonema papillatum]
MTRNTEDAAREDQEFASCDGSNAEAASGGALDSTEEAGSSAFDDHLAGRAEPVKRADAGAARSVQEESPGTLFSSSGGPGDDAAGNRPSITHRTPAANDADRDDPAACSGFHSCISPTEAKATFGQQALENDARLQWRKPGSPAAVRDADPYTLACSLMSENVPTSVAGSCCGASSPTQQSGFPAGKPLSRALEPKRLGSALKKPAARGAAEPRKTGAGDAGEASGRGGAYAHPAARATTTVSGPISKAQRDALSAAAEDQSGARGPPHAGSSAARGEARRSPDAQYAHLAARATTVVSGPISKAQQDALSAASSDRGPPKPQPDSPSHSGYAHHERGSPDAYAHLAARATTVVSGPISKAQQDALSAASDDQRAGSGSRNPQLDTPSHSGYAHHQRGSPDAYAHLAARATTMVSGPISKAQQDALSAASDDQRAGGRDPQNAPQGSAHPAASRASASRSGAARRPQLDAGARAPEQQQQQRRRQDVESPASTSGYRSEHSRSGTEAKPLREEDRHRVIHAHTQWREHAMHEEDRAAACSTRPGAVQARGGPASKPGSHVRRAESIGFAAGNFVAGRPPAANGGSHRLPCDDRSGSSADDISAKLSGYERSPVRARQRTPPAADPSFSRNTPMASGQGAVPLEAALFTPSDCGASARQPRGQGGGMAYSGLSKSSGGGNEYCPSGDRSFASPTAAASRYTASNPDEFEHRAGLGASGYGLGNSYYSDTQASPLLHRRTPPGKPGSHFTPARDRRRAASLGQEDGGYPAPGSDRYCARAYTRGGSGAGVMLAADREDLREGSHGHAAVCGSCGVNGGVLRLGDRRPERDAKPAHRQHSGDAGARSKSALRPKADVASFARSRTADGALPARGSRRGAAADKKQVAFAGYPRSAPFTGDAGPVAVGQRVLVAVAGCTVPAVVRYVGKAHFAEENEQWVGYEVTSPLPPRLGGTASVLSSGTIQGVEYFTCPYNIGAYWRRIPASETTPPTSARLQPKRLPPPEPVVASPAKPRKSAAKPESRARKPAAPRTRSPPGSPRAARVPSATPPRRPKAQLSVTHPRPAAQHRAAALAAARSATLQPPAKKTQAVATIARKLSPFQSSAKPAGRSTVAVTKASSILRGVPSATPPRRPKAQLGGSRTRGRPRSTGPAKKDAGRRDHRAEAQPVSILGEARRQLSVTHPRPAAQHRAAALAAARSATLQPPAKKTQAVATIARKLSPFQSSAKPAGRSTVAVTKASSVSRLHSSSSLETTPRTLSGRGAERDAAAPAQGAARRLTHPRPAAGGAAHAALAATRSATLQPPAKKTVSTIAWKLSPFQSSAKPAGRSSVAVAKAPQEMQHVLTTNDETHLREYRTSPCAAPTKTR